MALRLVCLLSALLPATTATTVTLAPHTLSTATLALPPVTTASSLTLRVQGGRGALQISASFQGSLATWSLELAPGSNHSRQLCVAREGAADSLFLSLLSTDREPVEVQLAVEETRGEYNIGLNQEVTFHSYEHPVFQFKPSLDASWNNDQYLVKINNPGGRCLEVGFSNPDCPWKNDVRTMKTNQMWAHVLKQGLFPVKARDFSGSMAIFIIPAARQEDCFYNTEEAPNFDDSKDNVVKLVVTNTNSDYVTPSAYFIGALLVISIPTVALLIVFWFRKHKKEEEVEQVQKETEIVDQDEGKVNLNSLDQVDATVDENGHNNMIRRSTQLLPELACLFLNDDKHRYLRSDAYFHLVPLLAVFYIIPSAQLVFLTEEANSEACRFNYGCSMPLAIFKAFNHVFSNLGYIWFGLCFMLLVWVKSKYFKEEQKEKSSKQRGLPQQYGLYYAMGLAMVAQGLLSAIFHVCPSNTSLQFDTTMMYLIMTLVMVKLYQFRHPDTTVNAFACLSLLALALLFEAVSVHLINFSRTNVAIFTVLFCTFYVAFVLWLGKAFYLNRKSRQSQHAVEFLPCCVCTWVHLVTIFFFIAVNLCVLAYVVVSVWGKEKSLSTPLLIVIGSNMFLYLAYYMVRKLGEILRRASEKEDRDMAKERQDCEDGGDPTEEPAEGWVHWLSRILHLRHRKCKSEEVEEAQQKELVEVELVAMEEADSEGQCSVNLVRWISYILFSTALVVALVAGAFYANKHQSRNLSPAQSREKNAECIFLDFYDNHDLWHFFSSLALFLAFLGLLTIDDDILYVKQERITVF